METVYIEFPERDHDILARIAAATGCSVGELITEAIERFLFRENLKEPEVPYDGNE